MAAKFYPIYRFWLTFTDADHNLDGSKMFKESLTKKTGKQALQEFIDRNLDAARQGAKGQYTLRSLNLTVVSSGWEFVREDTWCCRWFNHYTFNVHLADPELFRSFEEFVARHRGKPYTADDYICLMGAEDRWRWKDPCRCEHCQERGVVTIDH